MTHREVRDYTVRLGLETCISRVENLTGTLSSSLCQTLNKETVGLIPVIGVWLLTLELDITTEHHLPWTLLTLLSHHLINPRSLIIMISNHLHT